ncbi:MAG: MBL fold metallo-hydrolase [Marinifilaceae bacterium]|jgi:glyoxylase-like metal-dependent hydrolase (beta-lactamase superfamily II)|nr:MBL fold metallo-hydrolase [Marinifilaceae bacterium]
MIKVEKFVFNQWQQNTYLVYDETNEGVLIDCGVFYPEEGDRLVKFIKDNNIEIKYLLNTHLHIDHVMGNRFVFETLGLKATAHEADLPVLRQAPQYAVALGLEATVEPPEDINFVNHNDVVKFGNTEIKVLHIPGHSPGHVAYLFEENNIAMVGDILFRESIGRTDLPYGNYDQLIEGIKNNLLCLNDELVIYSGHGPETSIGFERMNNPYLRNL